MKLIHISDIHLGKRLNEYSLAEDQELMIREILRAVEEEAPDAVLIAGDVYDKSVPSGAAVTALDGFLSKLAALVPEIFIVSGNHDSPERLAYLGGLLDSRGIHISPVYSGEIPPYSLEDEHGSVNLYLLPFVKPREVERYLGGEYPDYNSAVRAAVEAMNIDASKRNILVTHQFVTGASRTESEEISVGGSDNVDAEVFEIFDYTALGHIHRAQSFLGGKVRYSGSPLKYSFSEANDEKSLTVIELQGKGELEIRTLPLKPLHDMRELRGSYSELMSRETYLGKGYAEDYMHLTLTDEDDIPDAVSKLRVVYKNLMKLDYDNKRTRAVGNTPEELTEEKSPIELFSDFFLTVNGQQMNDEQRATVVEVLEGIEEKRREGVR